MAEGEVVCTSLKADKGQGPRAPCIGGKGVPQTHTSVIYLLAHKTRASSLKALLKECAMAHSALAGVLWEGRAVIHSPNQPTPRPPSVANLAPALASEPDPRWILCPRCIFCPTRQSCFARVSLVPVSPGSRPPALRASQRCVRQKWDAMLTRSALLAQRSAAPQGEFNRSAAPQGEFNRVGVAGGCGREGGGG